MIKICGDSFCHSYSPMFMERVQKIVWVPPNYCNAVACSYAGGTLSLWEEIVVSTLELGIVVHRSFVFNGFYLPLLLYSLLLPHISSIAFLFVLLYVIASLNSL